MTKREHYNGATRARLAALLNKCRGSHQARAWAANIIWFDLMWQKNQPSRADDPLWALAANYNPRNLDGEAELPRFLTAAGMSVSGVNQRCRPPKARQYHKAGRIVTRKVVEEKSALK